MSDTFELLGDKFEADEIRFVSALDALDPEMTAIFLAHRALLTDESPTARQRFNAAVLSDLEQLDRDRSEQ